MIYYSTHQDILCLFNNLKTFNNIYSLEYLGTNEFFSSIKSFNFIAL